MPRAETTSLAQVRSSLVVKHHHADHDATAGTWYFAKDKTYKPGQEHSDPVNE